MDKNKALEQINSTVLMLLAHPDNTADSEFADRIYGLKKALQLFSTSKVAELPWSEDETGINATLHFADYSLEGNYFPGGYYACFYGDHISEVVHRTIEAAKAECQDHFTKMLIPFIL